MHTYTPADLNFQSVSLIQAALAELKTDQLHLATPDEFERRINQYINNKIEIKEKIQETKHQDIRITQFYWGHDHDFGAFKVSGLMGTRHIWMLTRFLDDFGLPLTAIENKHVLDIGCWTGGVSLVLNKLGGKIVAIDDTYKYIHALSYLIDSFNLADLECYTLSLYDLEQSHLTTKFDIVFFLGVIYHLSDPIVALRRIYNVMKPGALLCLESMSIDSDKLIFEYEGPSRKRGIFGWNWFVPSPPALFKLLEDTGFEDIKVGNGLTELSITNEIDPMGPNRCFAIARKKAHHVMSQAGLSTDII